MALKGPQFSAQLPSLGVYFIQIKVGKNAVHTTTLERAPQRARERVIETDRQTDREKEKDS